MGFGVFFTTRNLTGFTTDDLTEGSTNKYVGNEAVQDIVGAMVSSNTETGITVTYQDADGTLDFVVGTLNQDTTGSAATLTTARTIGGVSFDGSANINLPGVNTLETKTHLVMQLLLLHLKLQELYMVFLLMVLQTLI